MTAFEENEISKNAFGGTELMKRRLGDRINPDLLQDFQIIPSRIRELDDDKIRVLWLHDLPEDPESEKLKNKTFRDKFHKIVFVSNWQYNRYQLVSGMPYDLKSTVIEHGIEPSSYEEVMNKDYSGPIRIAYTSTPQRGLEILVPVFEHLAKTNSNIHLDVFSSFEIYGWKEADKQFESLYEKIKNHPQMTYRGFVPNNELRSHLNKCHIHAYPSKWLETSCLALIEAMSSGLLCVHPNLAALSDTAGGMTFMYQGSQDLNEHANIFAVYLENAIRLVKEGNSKSIIQNVKAYADGRFHIDRAVANWESMLLGLKEQYPTKQSREIKKGDFLIYKTT